MALPKSVILFGGTFDPPHIGHLAMAQMAYEQSGAEAVWFLPAPDPPHKQHEEHLQYGLRARMVQAMLSAMSLSSGPFSVSHIEESLPKPSYTVDTVRHCKQVFPNTVFYFLIGTDSLHDLPSWHEADHLTRLIRFLVVPRHEYPFETTLEKVQRELPYLHASRVDMPILDVSSTWVRQRYIEGKSLCGFVCPEVLALFPKAMDG